MESTKPYLIRAIFDWCIESNLTPYILVKKSKKVNLLPKFFKNNEIVINISPVSVKKLIIKNDLISFTARFEGVPQDIYCPLENIKSIYAFENGEGLFFDRICITGKQAKKTKKYVQREIKKPHLRIVK